MCEGVRLSDTLFFLITLNLNFSLPLISGWFELSLFNQFHYNGVALPFSTNYKYKNTVYLQLVNAANNSKTFIFVRVTFISKIMLVTSVTLCFPSLIYYGLFCSFETQYVSFKDDKWSANQSLFINDVANVANTIHLRISIYQNLLERKCSIM